MGKPRPAQPPLATMTTPDAPSASPDMTSQALQQMDATLHIHTSQFDKVLKAILDTKNTPRLTQGVRLGDSLGQPAAWNRPDLSGSLEAGIAS
ncbi:hypothetical protein NDU88_000625 [Pleurodeles waltl]|uniref:Uncharacterized protein n=1 Tax=Pleurodeles waltl TaxID=8319 RepID=A0AAV7THT2_PLEWA|nr:hypothetical protein NDU88_000625 [Pleurodeles waltl]